MAKLSRLHIDDMPSRTDAPTSVVVPIELMKPLDVMSSRLFADQSDGLNERIFRFERCAQSEATWDV